MSSCVLSARYECYLNCLSKVKECKNYDHFLKCREKPLEDVNIFQSNYAKFAKCPTTKFCFNPESELRIKAESCFLVEDCSALNIEGNSSIEIDGDADLKLTKQSYILNRGRIYINSSKFVLTVSSQIRNHGTISIDEGFMATLRWQALLVVSHSGHLMVETHAKELEIIDDSTISLSCDHCLPGTQQKLILKNGSRLSVHLNSSLNIISGDVVLNTKSDLSIYSDSQVYVDGYMNFSEGSRVTVNTKSSFVIGEDDESSTKGDANASLMSKESNLVLKVEGKFSINKGAHCLLKRSFNIDVMNYELNSRTRNEYFVCYDSREALLSSMAS